jgi:hypothetical protein
MKTKLGSIAGKYYANVIMVDTNGDLLATISHKRADWYLRKKLANEITPPSPYPRAIQLTFENEMREQKVKTDVTLTDDCCVICGNRETLSLHHVIPYVLRRHMPLEHKRYSRIWCVLLCEECHVKAEAFTQPLYKKDFPQRGSYYHDGDLTLQIIKAKGDIEKVGEEKMKILFARSSYKTVEEIPNNVETTRANRGRRLSESHQEAIKEWAIKFVADNGGVSGIKTLFSDIFMKMNPQYLPDGYLEIHKKT